ncbi:MAG: helix-turn-helix domain-containing protein [Rariglobus sp.]|nr:AraC family transcriptional regulator [Rariglobus sp.]
MYLTKTSKLSPRALASLAARARRLDSPSRPLHGVRRQAPPLPENIICFQRRTGAELNHPQRGRAMHHRHVLIVPLKGRAVVCADDVELTLSPGRGLVILPYQYHHYKNPDKKLHWLFITFEYAQGVAMEPLRNVVFPLNTNLVVQLNDLLRAQRDLAELGLPELRLALLLSELAPPPNRTTAAAPGSTLKLQVNHALQQRRPVAPSIRELAAELGMSPSNLRTRFRASCGVSLGKHMRELRLERACGLLRMTSVRISEIAEQCGFNSLFSFSRTFRIRHGVSPKAYRESTPKD